MFLCFVEVVLAILWRHVFGEAYAMFSLIFACLLVVVWLYLSSSKILRISALALNAAVLLFLAVLILVHFMGDVSYPGLSSAPFPSSCRRTTNCARLTTNLTANVGMNGTAPLVFNSSLELLGQAAALWSGHMLNMHYLENTLAYQHIMFVTTVFGFPDDVYLQLYCNAAQQAVLWVQSESRLGVGDFGVNAARVGSLVRYLGQQSLAQVPCTNTNFTAPPGL
jgi:uncharacterized protein (DUF1499 family)